MFIYVSLQFTKTQKQMFYQTEKANIKRQIWAKSWFLTRNSVYDRKPFLQSTPILSALQPLS